MTVSREAMCQTLKDVAAIFLSLAATNLMLEFGPDAASITAIVLGLLLCFGPVTVKVRVRQ